MARKRFITRAPHTNRQLIEVPQLVADLDETTLGAWVDVSSFGTGWQAWSPNVDSNHQRVRYRRLKLSNSCEIVMGEGLVQNFSGGTKFPSPGQVIYTLDVNHRPDRKCMSVAVSHNGTSVAVARLSIGTDGNVVFEEGSAIPNGGWINVQFWFFK